MFGWPPSSASNSKPAAVKGAPESGSGEGFGAARIAPKEGLEHRRSRLHRSRMEMLHPPLIADRSRSLPSSFTADNGENTGLPIASRRTPPIISEMSSAK